MGKEIQGLPALKETDPLGGKTGPLHTSGKGVN